LLPIRKLPECWEEIESLILKRIREYPEIEVGGLLLINGVEFGEFSCYTGDETSILLEDINYLVDAGSEGIEKIFYRLKDDFVKRESGGYKDKFLSEIKERGFQDPFAKLVIENIENLDLDSIDALGRLSKTEVEGPKEFDLDEDLTFINYHSHLNGYLKPSSTDIRTAQKIDKVCMKYYML